MNNVEAYSIATPRAVVYILYVGSRRDPAICCATFNGQDPFSRVYRTHLEISTKYHQNKTFPATQQ